MPLAAIIYTSTMLPTITLEDMQKISDDFMSNNKIHNISGVLLFYRGVVLQYIEGERTVLDRLYLNILKDTRHYNIITLFDDVISSKLFKDWGLKFHRYDITKYIKTLECLEDDVYIIFKSFLLANSMVV